MSNENPLKHIFAIELTTGKKTFFLEKNAYSIGRSSTSAIALHHRVISRSHATLLKVTYEEENKNKPEIKFWIIDGDLKGNRSTNGIFVNGQKCLMHQLSPGDLVVLGGLQVRAKYDIVDVNSKTFYSLLKNQEVENLNESQAHETSSTLPTFENKTYIEPLTEYFLHKINQLNDVYDYPSVTINNSGEIVNISSTMLDNFADLEALKLEHPLLKNIDLQLQENQPKFLIREISLNEKNYTEYISYSDQGENINIYLLAPDNQDSLETEIKYSEIEYKSIIEQISEAVVFIDLESQEILNTNTSFYQMLGYTSKEEVIGRDFNEFLGVDRDILHENIKEIISSSATFMRESINRKRNGQLIDVEMRGRIAYFLGKKALCFCINNISEQKNIEELLRYQSCHDNVTNLANRKLFREQLSAMVGDANIRKEDKSTIAVCLLKINELREIGYEQSYEIADLLLQKIARKIKKTLSARDIVGRWRDDEFAILLNQNDKETVEVILAKVMALSVKPTTIKEQSIGFSFSMATAYYPQQGDNEEDLLKGADRNLRQNYLNRSLN